MISQRKYWVLRKITEQAEFHKIYVVGEKVKGRIMFTGSGLSVEKQLRKSLKICARICTVRKIKTEQRNGGKYCRKVAEVSERRFLQRKFQNKENNGAKSSEILVGRTQK